MDTGYIHEELRLAAQELTAGRLPDASEYREGMKDLSKAFETFSRQYMRSIEKIHENKAANLLLSGSKAKKQRDDIVDAWVALNNAINTHEIFISRA